MSVVKPKHQVVSDYFKVGDKVEVLEGSDTAFYNTYVGAIYKVVESCGMPVIKIDGLDWDGGFLILRKVSSSTKKKGLCSFLEKVREDYGT